MPEFSVVVPTVGRPSLLELLAALDSQTIDPSRFEVIVVADGCHLDNLIEGTTFAFSVRAVTSPSRQGPGAARNLGARLANRSSSWLVFTEDDIIPRPDWLQCMAHTMLNDCYDLIEGETILPNGLPARIVAPGKLSFIPTNIAVRRETFESIGGFCEDYFTPEGRYFREDSDFGFSILDSNARVIRIADAVVCHPFEHAGFWDPLRWAQRYELDPLLRRRHQMRYRQMIEVHKAGKFTVRRPFVKLAKVYTASCALSMVGLIAGTTWLVAPAGISAVLCCALLWKKWDFAVNKLPLVPITPIVLLWSVARGELRFRSVSAA
jgi:glycosyltransferase involved in cell wall biosynthesis